MCSHTAIIYNCYHYDSFNILQDFAVKKSRAGDKVKKKRDGNRWLGNYSHGLQNVRQFSNLTEQPLLSYSITK